MAPPRILQDKLNERLTRFKDNVSIEYGDRSLTYAELDRRSDIIAHWIINRGIEPHTFMGVLMNDRIDAISTIVGILKARCVIVPLYPGYPNGRITDMIRSTDIKFIFIDQANASRFKKSTLLLDKNKEFLFINDFFPGNEVQKFTGRPGRQCSGEDPLYIHFTSGSTGVPKAVLGKNKSLLHFIQWEIDRFQIDSRFRVAQFTIPGFDPFLRDVFVPLCSGGVVCIPETEEILLSSGQLIQWLDENQVGLIHCVPSLFRMLKADFLTPAHFKSLKCILLAGEKVTPSDFVHWYDTFNERVQLVNCYGPTETTMSKAFYFIGSEDIHKDRIPIGKPMEGSRIIILDENMKICSPLDVGEIYIRTPFRSFGYYNDLELTRRKFIQNPFNDDPNDILYRTGDLGRFLLDGNIDILGRVDRQVKIRGYRIELEEIEIALTGYPYIKDAVVVKKERTGNNEILCAYVTVEKIKVKEDFDDKLKEFLSGKLPDYMVPAHIKIIDKIPRGATGKVDFNALPDPFQRENEICILPRDHIERKLGKLWTEILGIEKIGIDERFIQLGGNSLNVMALISKIHKEFNIRIGLGEFFNHQTIKTQAEIIHKSEQDRFAAIEAVEEKEFYILSSAQKRFYIMHQINEKKIGYNITSLVGLEGNLDRSRLEQDLTALIQRHESLRTSFIMIKEEPRQQVHARVKFEIEYHCEERKAQSAERKEEPHEPYAMCSDSIIKNFIRPFDLTAAPLMRVGLVKIREANHLLIIDMHHIISDGMSLEIFVRELSALYRQKDLSTLKLQYKDFSGWQNQCRKKDQLDKYAAYWHREFKGEIPVLELPTDYKRSEAGNLAGKTLGFTLGKDETQALRAMASAQNTTVFVVLLAAFNILLARLSGSEDIIVGTPTAGRRHADLEQLIGVFINTLALRNYTAGGKTVGNFLAEVNNRTLEAFENQDYPFEDLVDDLDIPRDFSRNPLFDVMLVLQNIPTQEIEIPGITVSKLEYEDRPSKFDLTLTGLEGNHKLHFTINYNPGLFKEESINKFKTYFKRILICIRQDPGMKLMDIDLLHGEEKRRILVEFNRMTVVDFPRRQGIHEIFEKQVNRFPGKRAVLCEEETAAGVNSLAPISVTYRQLDDKANHLAALLRKKGIKANSIVGILSEPSLEMLVGIWAVLKAGGAFLPIDVEHPGERIRFMLKNSSAPVLLLTRRSFKEKVKDLLKGEITVIDNTLINDSGREYTGINKNEVTPGPGGEIAYLVYTSGTTGKPKGVFIDHRNLVNYVTWFCGKITVTERDKTILASSLTFDLGYTVLFSSLLQGGEFHLLSRETLLSVNKLSDYIGKMGITYMKVTPSFFNLIVHSPYFFPGVWPDLRYIVLGGEPIMVKDVEKAFAICPHIKVMNHYGPTETTIGTAAQCIDAEAFHTYRETPTIGRPIANARAYILDKNLKAVPVGISGELCIGGEGVSRGYLNNPVLTDQRFIHRHIPGSDKLYRTGDLAQWQPDGNIKLLGRIDNQVKIRGYRVELEEIQCHLLKYEGVKESIVVVEPNNKGEKELISYVVPTPDLGMSELKEYLNRRLPNYMIPTHIISLDHFPLTANGKLDKKRLPEPDRESFTLETPYAAPQNDMEEIITAAWKEILGMETIGINDNFFDLGGNSLKIILINNKLKEVLKKDIPVVEMFRYTTIAELGRNLGEEVIGTEPPGTADKRLEAVNRGRKSQEVLRAKRKMVHPNA